MSTSRKIRCTDCGEAVPYGRLSCPSCGTLLASVAGGVRHAPAPAVVAATPIPMAATATEAPVAETPVAAASQGLQPRPLKPTPSRPVAQRAAAQLTLVPTTVVRSVTAGAGVFMPATAGATAGAATAAAVGPSGGWSTHVDGDRATAGESTKPSTDMADGDADTEAALGFFAFSLDHQRLDAGLEWAAALGAGVVAVAMLLPWSRSVIGSSGIGYFDSWGLAGPGHVLLLIGSLVVLALAVVPSNVPIWISRGLGPLVLGVFALGLTWPYAIGPLGGGIGIVLTLVGAIVLIVTGVVGDWHSRHAPEEPPV